ncbi:MAG TPA: dolichyl-phosphate beta-glucosyltransferase [Candidatus Binatia bacterium]|nr:dolichyl-phosphate beta-glucosyltransferase [Candidatus Binatia bacterium]
MLPSITIVIPAYNEAARLGRTLDRILDFIHQEAWGAEIIVVDDGSSDGTAEIAQTYARENPCVRLLSNPGNRGKGYSVRNGILHANGEFILFTDADLSSPIEEAPKLFRALEDGCDIAIGSRWAQPELQTQRQSLTRQILGRVFNAFLRLFLGLKLNDTQCGFKALRQPAAKAIFPSQRIEGWGFDPEILYLAQKSGFTIAEVPVVWAHDDRTHIHPLADGAKMIADMIRIRWYELSGKYINAPAVQPAPVRATER